MKLSEEDFASRLGNIAKQKIAGLGDRALRRFGSSAADGRVKMQKATDFLIAKWNAFCAGRAKYGATIDVDGKKVPFDRLRPNPYTLALFLRTTFNVRIDPAAIAKIVANTGAEVTGKVGESAEAARLRKLVSEATGLNEAEPQQKPLPLHQIFGLIAVALTDAGLLTVGGNDTVRAGKLGDQPAGDEKRDTSSTAAYTKDAKAGKETDDGQDVVSKDTTIDDDGYYFRVRHMREVLTGFKVTGDQVDKLRRASEQGPKAVQALLRDGDGDATDAFTITALVTAALTSIKKSVNKDDVVMPVGADREITSVGQTILFGRFKKLLGDHNITGEQLMKLRSELLDKKHGGSDAAAKSLANDPTSTLGQMLITVSYALLQSIVRVADMEKDEAA